MNWDYRISTRPTYTELKRQHERWLSQQHLDLAAATSDDFLRWTDARIAVVKEMWAAGKQLKSIAYALGPTFTKSMVGKLVNRLDLPRRRRKRRLAA